MPIDIRERGRKGERETLMSERNIDCCLLHTPQQGLKSTSEVCAFSRIEPTASRCLGQHSSQPKHTPARAITKTSGRNKTRTQGTNIPARALNLVGASWSRISSL